MARRLVAPNYLPRYQKFVETYAREHPLLDLKFARPSIMELWYRETRADIKLVDSLGTIPEAMTDVADRLQMYGDVLPSQTLWRAELALGESGYSRGELRSALQQLDSRLDRMAAAADNAPDEQRQALALDAARIGDQVMTTAGQEIRHLAREVVLLGILMAVILLGLPFAAGYLVGRTRRDRSI